MSEFSFSYDPKSRISLSDRQPAWSTKVERWHQLDEASYALCEAVQAWKDTDHLKPFSQLIYIGCGGSNVADAEFVKSLGPAKFVYTLVNIAPSVLCQSLNWSGPVTCFSLNSQAGSGFEPEIIKYASLRAQQNKAPSFVVKSNLQLDTSGHLVIKGIYVDND